MSSTWRDVDTPVARVRSQDSISFGLGRNVRHGGSIPAVAVRASFCFHAATHENDHTHQPLQQLNLILPRQERPAKQPGTHIPQHAHAQRFNLDLQFKTHEEVQRDVEAEVWRAASHEICM